MAYAILRFKKHPGGTIAHMENHNERKKSAYRSNPDVDVSRSEQNYHLIKPNTTYRQEINKRIAEAGCKVRKDSILMIETLITCTPEYMKALPPERQKEYFRHALELLKTEVGEQNIFSAVVHMDEVNPHMHLCFTPITPDKRLSAKIIMGGPDKLSAWQDKYFEHMHGKFTDLERGIPAAESKRKHIPVRLFKQGKRLESKMEEIKQAVSDITVFNAGKKREEALGLLTKWLPAAECFSREVKKNEAAIKALESQLEQKDEKLSSTISELIVLEKTARQQKKLLDKLPPEILRELRSQKSIGCGR